MLNRELLLMARNLLVRRGKQKKKKKMQEQYNIAFNGLEKPPTDGTTDDLTLSSEEPTTEQINDLPTNGTKNKQQYETDQDERAKKRQKR